MASEQEGIVEQIASRCTNPERGCFADDPDTLAGLVTGHPSGLRRSVLREAGLQGFKHGLNGGEEEALSFEDADQESALDPDNVKQAAARCGFRCAKLATGKCSVFKESAFDQYRTDT